MKKRQLDGLKFRRQYSAGPFILDFYCPEANVGIEVDGERHFRGKAQQKDEARTRLLRSLGIHVLRFDNYQVRKDLHVVLELISNECRARIGAEKQRPE